MSPNTPRTLASSPGRTWNRSLRLHSGLVTGKPRSLILTLLPGSRRQSRPDRIRNTGPNPVSRDDSRRGHGGGLPDAHAPRDPGSLLSPGPSTGGTRRSQKRCLSSHAGGKRDPAKRDVRRSSHPSVAPQRGKKAQKSSSLVYRAHGELSSEVTIRLENGTLIRQEGTTQTLLGHLGQDATLEVERVNARLLVVKINALDRKTHIGYSLPMTFSLRNQP